MKFFITSGTGPLFPEINMMKKLAPLWRSDEANVDIGL